MGSQRWVCRVVGWGDGLGVPRFFGLLTDNSKHIHSLSLPPHLTCPPPHTHTYLPPHAAKFIPIHPLSKLPYAKLDSAKVNVKQGVIFLTYSALISSTEKVGGWAGGCEGVV